MKLKIGEKLKTASLNTNFTCSKKMSVLRFAQFWKTCWNLMFPLKYKLAHQQTQERFSAI